jgi:hypothetical protein
MMHVLVKAVLDAKLAEKTQRSQRLMTLFSLGVLRVFFASSASKGMCRHTALSMSNNTL